MLPSCKAYDLDDAIESLSPFTGPRTAVLPLLNGIQHLDVLDERLGPKSVLGGRCMIAATLGEHGEIIHLNNVQGISFGERDGSLSERVRAIAELMQGTKFEAHVSTSILLEMWEKWVFLASLAGSTCLMRAAVGDIAEAPGGSEFVLGLLEECRSIAAANGYAPREDSYRQTLSALTANGSTLTASMLRDVKRNARIEADHIVGDLLRRSQGDAPRLKIAYLNLKAYEARRARMDRDAATSSPR